jgi:predicted ATPase
LNESPHEQQSLAQQAETALKEAARKVVREAQRTGATVVVWHEGAVVEIPADQLPNLTEQTNQPRP